MKRREFITLLGGAAAAWPLAARAQQPERLALLGSGAAQSSNIFVEALKQGLADNGLIEGKAYVLDVRWAEGEYGRFPALAADAVKQNPSLIFATTIAAVRAAQRASSIDPDRHDHDQRPGGSRTRGQPGAAWREYHGDRQSERGHDAESTGNPAYGHSDRD